MEAAKADDNLAQPIPLVPRPRIQLMYDACTRKKEHGCTRLMLCSPDLLFNFNSTRYSRDVVFYGGRDKHADLEANFTVGGKSSIAEVLRQGATTSKVPDGNAWEYLTKATLKLPGAEEQECKVCDVVASGDMAAAQARWALDSPIADYRCCFWCELKKLQWFEEVACAQAQRRNLFRTYCASHVRPFAKLLGLPVDPCPAPRCPHCGVDITRVFEE
eukprot:449026-Pleurochrysis_carterae.AAC.1